MQKSVLLVLVLGSGLLAQTPDPASPKEPVKSKTEVEQLKSDLADEQARRVYTTAQLELSSAIMQAENQFHLSDRQRAMQAAYQALSTRLGCKAGLDAKLDCATAPQQPTAPVNTMPKTIPPPPAAIAPKAITPPLPAPANSKAKPGSVTPLKK